MNKQAYEHTVGLVLRTRESISKSASDQDEKLAWLHDRINFAEELSKSSNENERNYVPPSSKTASDFPVSPEPIYRGMKDRMNLDTFQHKGLIPLREHSKALNEAVTTAQRNPRARVLNYNTLYNNARDAALVVQQGIQRGVAIDPIKARNAGIKLPLTRQLSGPAKDAISVGTFSSPSYEWRLPDWPDRFAGLRGRPHYTYIYE